MFFLKVVYGKKLFIGKGTTFRKGFSVMIDINAKIVIGKNCFFNNYCSIVAHESVKIGNNTIFGENVKIYDHNHKYNRNDRSIKEQGYSSSKIEIGNDCWIASNVVILKGVKIGDRCVIGAGCIVYKDIPAGHILTNQQQQVLKKIAF